ncbi:YTH domain-containing protein [Citrus sinensis]|nr:YTH domain-containing protein [Citrus sinensis]
MLHRPYITTQLPSVRGHGHLYHAQQFSASDPSCFQQPISPKKPCILSSTSVSQGKLPAHIDLQGDSKRFGLKPNYAPSLGSTSKGGDFLGNSDGLDFFHQGSEGCEIGGLWSNWSKPLNGKSSLLQLSSAAASLTPIRSLEFSRDDFEMASQWRGSFFGFGSCTGSRYRGYSHCLSDQGSEYGCVSTSSMEMDGQNWPSLTEARQGGRCNNFSCSCTVTLDTLSERNRGPRAFKPKVRTTAYGFAVDNSKNGTLDDILKGSYNQLDFVTNYKVAKFFIIKSYSEDNVHKSIKYGLWASTPNGNKKLDAAYREAKEKHGTCPIFLLFSVNASAQFCGVAEMVGPVDFDKSVDYWLQDKWSGQFPVKWHIIKDVPNSQFRHIILEKNDNKPVTNSRDTQEVELEQGIEMLNIFKNYESYSSILDDFHFYEQRQKAMQERKAGQQANRVAPPLAVGGEKQNQVSLSNDFIKTMSKSFAEAVLLTEHQKEHSSVRNVVSTAAVAHGD